MRIYLAITFLTLVSCTASVEYENDPAPTKGDVDQVLNDWHRAAADADFKRYFDHFENDSSIFMGTDGTERWIVAEFKSWSKPYFDRGKAWSFNPLKRFVYFSDNGKTAWFDETLDTPNLGPSRGTGVLTKTKKGWKISHYNLTVPIPNELVDAFIPKIDSVLNK